MQDLWELYYEHHAQKNKKPKSAKEDEWLWNNSIITAMGRYKVINVQRLDIMRLHQKLSATPYKANRCLRLLSKMFNLAEKWSIRSDNTNPTRHVGQYKERKRERFLSTEEVQRLSNVLADSEMKVTIEPQVAAAFRLLLLTGCRMNEILTLKWKDVDLTNRKINLSDSKTGARTVLLNDAAFLILQNINREDNNPYVVFGKLPGQHWHDLKKVWDKIRRKAGLGPTLNTKASDCKGHKVWNRDGLRIHDLRHTFASHALNGGAALSTVGKLLGHTQVQTTARYAHLMEDTIREGTAIAAKSLGAIMGGKSAEVVEFKRT